ncbi:hypothetical protein DID74_01475 [Candidatus Marinamargulisbacteria bacterium SCGC AG-333-B06]|nr:hypothetical protein DID74_01475 [Candidatus Marinamargulisbacteria bacterium SCGC AG-333-B06]
MTRPILTVSETRAIETYCLQSLKITEYELMKRAGKALLEYIKKEFSDRKTIQIICGSGNNGGDGYTLARLLLAEKKDVQCYEGKEPTQTSAKQARKELIKAGLNPRLFVELRIKKDALIIDALLGIGCNKPVKGTYADIITIINQAKEPVLSADMPSGLCADTGKPLGCCIKQATVLSFITKKLGTVIGDSKQIIRKVDIDRLGIPIGMIHHIKPQYQIMDQSVLDPVTQKRSSDAYKNQFGHVLLIGGDKGYGGAIMLATQTASQSGVGLVSVYTKKDHKEPLLTQCPDCMIYDDESDLKTLIEKATAIIVGPGLGLNQWGKTCLSAVLESTKPLVCDADALTILADRLPFPKRDNIIITPHIGEAKRLLGDDCHHDRYAMLKALCKTTRATVILKGQNTLVKQNDSHIYICPLGNPGLATAGTGDVLAGLIGGFLAQGYDTLTASQAGVYLHALCGDACRDKYSERSMTATDLVMMIKALF